MSYTYFSNGEQVTVINLTNGNEVTFFKDSPNYQRVVELLREKDYAAIEALDVKTVVTSFASSVDSSIFSLKIKDGIGTVVVYGTEHELNGAITDKILAMSSEGFDAQPLVNFVKRLYSNPSATAVNELFLFLDKSGLPITEDGYFIAYKLVRNDYKDIYTGKIDHSVGAKPSMPRFAVDDNRNNTCSAGFHFCSKSYLDQYGSSNRGTDRTMLVKVDPANVVSIPSDYNNAKGRCWTYEVVGEVTAKRETLVRNDYTSKPVVSTKGQEIKPSVANGKFTFNSGLKRWQSTNDGRRIVSRAEVARTLNVSLNQVISMEV